MSFVKSEPVDGEWERGYAAAHGHFSDLLAKAAEYSAQVEAENERLRAEHDNWEAACSGSIREQFRLARENEARLKLALEQLDKAATEIERLRELVLDAINGLEFHGHPVDASAIRSQLCESPALMGNNLT